MINETDTICTFTLQLSGWVNKVTGFFYVRTFFVERWSTFPPKVIIVKGPVVTGIRYGHVGPVRVPLPGTVIADIWVLVEQAQISITLKVLFEGRPHLKKISFPIQ
jgi:hypothetical protein